MKVVFLLPGFIAFVASCSPPNNQPAAEKPYFDIPAFLNQQINELRKDSFVVDQTTAVNGQNDEHILPWVDWQKEFALFYNSDINKTAFIGKYRIDSVIEFANTDSAVKRITYSATDSELHTKSVIIERSPDSNSIRLLHIVNSQSNILSSTYEELAFVPREGYVVKSFIHNKLFGENDFAIEGRFTKKKSNYEQDVGSPDQQ